MKSKGSKRKKFKKALKSTGRRIRNFAKARMVTRFLPLFGLIAIFTPSGPAHALTISTDGLDLAGFGKNGTFFAIAYEGMRQVTSHGVASIPDPKIRGAISTVGSISAMTAGVACGVGTAVCSAMGWEQKSVVCAGVAKGMHEGDPMNPIAAASSVAADAANAASIA